jgi:putative transposase
MANSYTQLHIQFVFAVKYRTALIHNEWKGRLHQYITGIFQHNNHKMIAINSMPDHIHILVGLNPNQAISSLIQNVKTESSKWIKAQRYCKSFAWQEGYSAFSNSKSHVPAVIDYIEKQESHHQRHTFLEEYKRMLVAFGLDYNEQYIFKELLIWTSFSTVRF